MGQNGQRPLFKFEMLQYYHNDPFKALLNVSETNLVARHKTII